ncbi:MAG TPA: DUF4255 domain-containing protein [Candidatus Limnocylindrales bacterium]|jgi:hypothetical protein
MIQDVDETLLALVRREALDGAAIEVAFDAPTRDWVARRNGPTVDLYLYDIREDMARREVQWERVTDDAGRVTERRPPPRRFKLSYMVTAWTQRPEDEHRLLSSLLGAFIRHERLAPAECSGALAQQPLPLLVTTALPLGSDRSIADLWSALGGELKPSLDLIVSAPFVVDVAQPAGPPVLEEPRLAIVTPLGNEEAGGSRRPERVAAKDSPPSPNETRKAGAENQPGRIVRVHGLRR